MLPVLAMFTDNFSWYQWKALSIWICGRSLHSSVTGNVQHTNAHCTSNVATMIARYADLDGAACLVATVVKVGFTGF